MPLIKRVLLLTLKLFDFRNVYRHLGTIIVNNNYPRRSGKLGLTTEEKAFLLEC
jgi:hypothetical protein